MHHLVNLIEKESKIYFASLMEDLALRSGPNLMKSDFFNILLN